MPPNHHFKVRQFNTPLGGTLGNTNFSKNHKIDKINNWCFNKTIFITMRNILIEGQRGR